MENKKCVFILDENLPIGLAANASAVLALNIGKLVEGIIGPDNKDKSGVIHKGITNTVLPILKSNKDKIFEICNQAKSTDGLLVIDFCNVAQRTKDYEDYTNQLLETDNKDLSYLGIAIFGDREVIKSLTGSLPLFR